MYNQKDIERLIADYQDLKDALGEINKHRFADQFLTNEEFCSLLDVSEKTAKRWRESQKIPITDSPISKHFSKKNSIDHASPPKEKQCNTKNSPPIQHATVGTSPPNPSYG